MFSDTKFARSMSQQGNKTAQTYATSFDWAHAHPMKHKGDAHETLSLFFQRNGVPPTMVTDDSKEQTKEEFDKNSRRLTAIHESRNPIPPGRKPLRAAFVN
jgi:hypothetical protein